MTDLQAPPTVIESDGAVTWSTLVSLARWAHDPCVTLTVPLDGGPDAAAAALDRVVAEAVEALQSYDTASRAGRDLVLRPLTDLVHRGLGELPVGAAGLVVTSAPGLWAQVTVPVPVAAAAHVGAVPHVLPLLPARRSVDRYAVLCIDEHRVRCLEGDADGLRPLPVAELPGTVDGIVWEADGGEPPEGHAEQLRRFLRRVDYAVVAHLGTAEPLPLIVVGEQALTERYAAASHYPWVVALQDASDAAGTDAELHRRTWPTAEAHLLAPLQAELDDVRRLAGSGLTLDRPDDVARAARNGEIAALVVAARWCEPGAERDHGVAPIDDAVVHTWRHRGTVFVAPDAELGPSGLAARLRY